MEMFDAHRRDILNFDNYMDLKKPGFGGPSSAMALRDGKGNIIDKSPKLDGYRRTVERDPAFSHPVYNPTYKAMSHDVVYKQEKKKPFTYDDTRTGIPVVEVEPVKEGKTYTSFERFINEADDYAENEEDEFSDFDEEEDEEIRDILKHEENAVENALDREDFEENGWSDSDDENEEDEFRTAATRSNQTISDLRDIEAKLRSFEETGKLDNEFESDEEFGANPFDSMESPEGDIPEWVKELHRSNR